ncbi:MAG: AraC family transcriptional regulator [Vicinamibacteria bacterium]
MPPFQRDDVRGHGGAISATRRSRTASGPARAAAVTHPFASLVYCRAGEATVELSERWRLTAGDGLLVPAGRPHRFLEMAQFEWYEVVIAVAGLGSGEEGSLLGPFERVRRGGAPVVRVPAERRAFLETLLRELTEVEAARNEGVTLVRHSLLTLVLNEVRRASQGAEEAAVPPGLAADALRFIEAHCLERLSLADVARAVRRSPAHVASTLSRATGRTAGEWITAGRLAEARRRLLHSDEMVDVIAERVGYRDATHFIRTFRRAHGATPAAWRAARRGARRRRPRR